MDNARFRCALAVGTALSLSFALASPACAEQTTSGGAPIAGTAGAQDSGAGSDRHVQGDEGGAQDIIVTARRVEERLQDVPISITVFNQQQIANRNVVNANDLAIYTPSLSANSNFGQENSSFAIRGFVQDAGTQPSVGVYFADVVALRAPTAGVQAGDGAGPGYFFDLQNVQVLKGPQGTLQGRNTTGGAVLFVPQKPTTAAEGYIEGSYGNYDMRRIQGMVNLPLADIARLRVAVDHQDRDGWLRNISGIGPRGYNDIGYTAVRGSLVLDITPDLENYTIVSYSRSNTNGSVQKQVGCNPTGFNPTSNAEIGLGVRNFIGLLACGQLARERRADAGFYDVEASLENPKSLLKQWQVINTATWRVSDTVTIKNIASYGQFRNIQRSPLFGTNWQVTDLASPYQQIFAFGVPNFFTGILPIPAGNTANQYTTTNETQIQGSALGGRLSYQGGAYLEYSGPRGLAGNQSNVLAPCADLASFQCSDPLGTAFTTITSATFSQQLGFPITIPVQIGAANYTAGKTTYRNVGLYTQGSYALTDQLKFTAGIRYTWDRQTNRNTRVTYSFPVFNFANGRPELAATGGARCTDPSSAPTCSARLERKSNKPTWLLDMDYKPSDDVLAYAKWARGYRAGGVFANAPLDRRTFGPEKVDSYEVGVKTSLRGALRGTFNVAAFYNDFSNQQLQVGFDARVDPATGATAPVSPTTGIVNAGKSRIYGIEVEGSITPFVGFTLDGSYTYLNATIRRIDPVTTSDPNYQISVGSIPRGSPLVLSPRNKATVTGSYTLPLDPAIGRITFAATYTHTDKQRTNYAYIDPINGGALRTLFGGDLGLLQSTDLLNLNASWNSVGGLPLDASVFATNVTKERYRTFVAGLATSGSEFAVLGEPRMYGVRLRYRFGTER